LLPGGSSRGNKNAKPACAGFLLMRGKRVIRTRLFIGPWFCFWEREACRAGFPVDNRTPADTKRPHGDETRVEREPSLPSLPTA
jgi:hypothetical protein